MSEINANEKIPGLMICAPASGSGKTLITCALLRILEKKGIKTASFKCGPDYIDPMFHKTVLGIPSRNLDLFLSGEEGVKKTVKNGAEGRDFCLIEGVMGYYDGMGVALDSCSSYEVAVATGFSAILVVNARGMSRSLVPMIKGFCEYKEDSCIRGIILNQCSKMVAEELSGIIEQETGVPVLGFLPVLKDLKLESRHLGLILPGEIPDLLKTIDRVADELLENLQFEKLLNVAEQCAVNLEPECEDNSEEENHDTEGKGFNSEIITLYRKNKVGIAMDEAFCFYYEDNIDLLKEMGAEIVPFSPIHDKVLPSVSHLIFGGGYPELHAKELSENNMMIDSIRRAAENEMPILAECGGFLYLKESLKDSEGDIFNMVNILPGKGYITEKLGHFGYVSLNAEKENPYLKPGEVIRGHEFHYCDTTDNGDVCRISKPTGNRSWQGYQIYNNVFAGFAHLYYSSCPEFIQRFLNM